MILKESPAIYGIYCKATGRWYVGASKTPKRRMKDHRRDLENDYKMSKQYPDWDYGYKGEMGRDYSLYRDSFEFCILEEVKTTKELPQAESSWIRQLGAISQGYNTQKEFADRRW